MTNIWEITTENPTPQLRPFIVDYSFRRAVLPPGIVFEQGMPMWCQTTLDFFLSEPVETIDDKTGKKLPFSRCMVRGLRTHKRNHIRIRGDFRIFIIRFTPIGFYHLFKIPCSEFTDEVIDGSLIIRKLFEEITERLLACSNIHSCVEIVEPYLLKLTRKNATPSDIPSAAGYLVNLMYAGLTPPPLRQLREKISLSERQLQRSFFKEIGTSPKKYSRMMRFIKLVYWKKEHSFQSWPSIAYEFGYTDQMHMIHDFKNFLGITPTQFDPDNFACFEDKAF